MFLVGDFFVKPYLNDDAEWHHMIVVLHPVHVVLKTNFHAILLVGYSKMWGSGKLTFIVRCTVCYMI